MASRREFTLEAALALLSGVAITISGCGTSEPGYPTGGGPNPQPTPTPTPTPTPSPSTSPTPGTSPTPSPGPTPVADEVGSISSNHGHSARITGGQLSAGGALSLNIQGASSHPHVVDLSAAEVKAIAGGGRVSKASSTNSGHSHTVTFN